MPSSAINIPLGQGLDMALVIQRTFISRPPTPTTEHPRRRIQSVPPSSTPDGSTISLAHWHRKLLKAARLRQTKADAAVAAIAIVEAEAASVAAAAADAAAVAETAKAAAVAEATVAAAAVDQAAKAVAAAKTAAHRTKRRQRMAGRAGQSEEEASVFEQVAGLAMEVCEAELLGGES